MREWPEDPWVVENPQWRQNLPKSLHRWMNFFDYGLPLLALGGAVGLGELIWWATSALFSTNDVDHALRILLATGIATVIYLRTFVAFSQKWSWQKTTSGWYLWPYDSGWLVVQLPTTLKLMMSSRWPWISLQASEFLAISRIIGFAATTDLATTMYYQSMPRSHFLLSLPGCLKAEDFSDEWPRWRDANTAVHEILAKQAVNLSHPQEQAWSSQWMSVVKAREYLPSNPNKYRIRQLAVYRSIAIADGSQDFAFWPLDNAPQAITTYEQLRDVRRQMRAAGTQIYSQDYYWLSCLEEAWQKQQDDHDHCLRF